MLELLLFAHASSILLDDLERAHALHTSGGLTAREYEPLKARLLSAPPSSPPPGSQPFFGIGTPDGELPPGVEYTLFDYNVTGTNGAMLTQFQLYGTGDPLSFNGFNDTRIRYFVDDEKVASVDYLLYLAHGMGTRARGYDPGGRHPTRLRGVRGIAGIRPVRPPVCA